MEEAGAMRPKRDYTGVTMGPGTRRYRLNPVRNRLLTAAFVVSIGVSLTADNWPQWRGPSLDGVSTEKGLPTTWSATENVAWKVPLPAFSGSTPVIWDDLVFLNVATERRTGSLELWAIDRNKRAVIWKRPLSGGNRIGNKQNMSSPSPVTDGRFVWVMTGTGILKAFDIAGKELWTRDIQKDYGPFGIQFGYASSPLLDGSALYLQVLHGMNTDDPSYVLRIDKMTGKTVWRVERPTDATVESPDSYTTPALLRRGADTQIVITGGDVVTGHDSASGKEVWRADVLNPENRDNYRIISSPVIAGELIIAPESHQSSRRPASWRCGRCLEDARGVDVPSRARRPITGQRRYLSLSGQRIGSGVLPRAGHRQIGLRSEPNPERFLQFVTRARGRQDLRHG